MMLNMSDDQKLEAYVVAQADRHYAAGTCPRCGEDDRDCECPEEQEPDYDAPTDAERRIEAWQQKQELHR